MQIKAAFLAESIGKLHLEISMLLAEADDKDARIAALEAALAARKMPESDGAQ